VVSVDVKPVSLDVKPVSLDKPLELEEELPLLLELSDAPVVVDPEPPEDELSFTPLVSPEDATPVLEVPSASITAAPQPASRNGRSIRTR
jgi:hypothetical protein